MKVTAKAGHVYIEVPPSAHIDALLQFARDYEKPDTAEKVHDLLHAVNEARKVEATLGQGEWSDQEMHNAALLADRMEALTEGLVAVYGPATMILSPKETMALIASLALALTDVTR